MPETVAVIGSGTMGAGIAQLGATAGHEVLLVDVRAEGLDRAMLAIRASLERLEAKGILGGNAAATLARIRPHLDDGSPLPRAEQVTVAIEAVPEDLSLKRQVLGAAESRFPAMTLLASNSSGLPMAELGEALARPDRLLGLHFFNPPTRIRVVEVIRGAVTAPETFARALGFVRSLGGQPLPVERELPGFVLNRIAMAASNEAIRLVELGVASPEAIDAGVKGAFGWKMGPLETADLIGLDVVLAARTAIFERTGDERFRPPELVRRLVESGKLGRKTGQGFYRYDS